MGFPELEMSRLQRFLAQEEKDEAQTRRRFGLAPDQTYATRISELFPAKKPALSERRSAKYCRLHHHEAEHALLGTCGVKKTASHPQRRSAKHGIIARHDSSITRLGQKLENMDLGSLSHDIDAGNDLTSISSTSSPSISPQKAVRFVS
ncbi:MAG: hypothetical protein MMC33_004863 [Icmadophila ericetorum]|nr:hypothetical protein [Icmadophila ericetorum]